VRLISVASSSVTLALLFHISSKLKFISILLLRTVSLQSSELSALLLLVSEDLSTLSLIAYLLLNNIVS